MIASRPFSCSANGFLLFLIILCNNRSIFCRIQPRLGFNFFKRKPSTVDGCALRYVCIWRVPITACLCQIRRHDTCQVIDTKFSVSLYHYVPRISFQIEKLRKFCLEKKIQRVDRSKYSPLLSVSLSRSSNGWIPARKNVASLDKIQSSVGARQALLLWRETSYRPRLGRLAAISLFVRRYSFGLPRVSIDATCLIRYPFAINGRHTKAIWRSNLVQRRGILPWWNSSVAS